MQYRFQKLMILGIFLSALGLSCWAAADPPDCDPKREPVECYRSTLEWQIRKEWTPKPFPDPKKATVRFVLNRDGQLMGLRMKQGSGVPALDESIQEAVIAAAPFQSLPTQILGEEAAFEFTFDYFPTEYFPPQANTSQPAKSAKLLP